MSVNLCYNCLNILREGRNVNILQQLVETFNRPQYKKAGTERSHGFRLDYNDEIKCKSTCFHGSNYEDLFLFTMRYWRGGELYFQQGE